MIKTQTQSEFYRDVTLEELTRQNPIRQVLGGWYNLLRIGGVLQPEAVFLDSTVSNIEARILFGDIVKSSAEQNEWVGVSVGLTSEIPTRRTRKSNLSDRLRSAYEAESEDLVRTVNDGGVVYAAPTYHFIGFVYNQLRGLSPTELPQFEVVPEYKPIPKDSPLTRRQYQILRIAASLNYEGGVGLHVSKVLKVTKSTVRNHLVLYLFPKLEVHDFFSAVYRALHNDYLSLRELVAGRLQDLVKRFGELSRREKEILSQFAACALKEGKVSESYIAD